MQEIWQLSTPVIIKIVSHPSNFHQNCYTCLTLYSAEFLQLFTSVMIRILTVVNPCNDLNSDSCPPTCVHQNSYSLSLLSSEFLDLPTPVIIRIITVVYPCDHQNSYHCPPLWSSVWSIHLKAWKPMFVG